MLASIHPLGERARNRRWGLTVSAYVLGSVTGGALLAGLLGAVGGALAGVARPGAAALGVLVLLLAATGIALDLGVGGARLPTVRRQVNEDWLHRYRGWVYGFGFGLQLGMGVVTIVTTSAVYLAFALALLSGSAARGAFVGAVFGLARGSVILAASRGRRPEALRRLHAGLHRRAVLSRRLAVVLQGAAALSVVAAVSRGGPWGG